MKRLTVLGAILFCTFFFNAYAQKEVKQVKNESSDQPYKLQATRISIGNPEYAQKVL